MAKDKHKTEDGLSDKFLAEQILDALRGIKYGCVQITVQDSRVVQIERTEKFRMCGKRGGDE